MPAFAGVIVGAGIGWVYGSILLVLGVLVLLFFRDPNREPLGGSRSILSPADGRVVGVEQRAAGHRLAPEARTRVSIFMSPLDVHVNRSPVDGAVEAVSYTRGQFGAAYKGDASEINESNALAVRDARGFRLVVVQIAGWLARRIVCDVHEGDALVRGNRFGLIMFGSRVDVYLPDGISVKVAAGERVRAGRSVIAEPNE